MANITWTKLRNGWGFRSTTNVVPGCTYPVTRRNGTVSYEVVGPLVWSGNGVWLYTTAPAPIEVEETEADLEAAAERDAEMAAEMAAERALCGYGSAYYY